ncbi:general odorant-binding protein 56h-like [Episyrphus balteatus]|uniref:general odorant-binding protein 56h-like n=1 Tax=Episyrphus balteatus TaxID=286459 RepID=UPI0024860F6C|nr:general odorant-binding protein 56h-like [Episyrphus balteatus]
MKFFAAILIFSTICLGIEAEQPDQKFVGFFMKLAETCQKKIGPPEGDVKKLFDGAFDKGGASQDVQCYIKCLMEEFETTDDDTQKDLKSNMNEEAANECNLGKKVDDCEQAYKTFMCVKENADKIFKKE